MIDPEITVTNSLLDQLVDLHSKELDERDLSVALGPVFIRGFYQELIQSPHGKLFVDIKDYDVRSVVCVFFAHTNFIRTYHKKFKLSIMLSCLIRPMLFVQLIRQLISSACVPASCADSHLGMIIINSSLPLTPDLVKSFRRNVKRGLDSLRDAGHDRVWGSTRLDNIRTINFLNKLHFYKTCECLGVTFFEKEL